MPKDDGSLPDEDKGHITSYTVLAIDQYAKPSSFCPNGHIIEWRNEESGISVCMARRVDTEAMTTEPICIVCGLPAKQEPEDAPSEGDTDN